MRFSIITPSYRSGRWLKQCIPSVADQAGVEFEHIVQDSCSDDETREWLPGDARVTAVIEKDTGMYDAVNRGFRRATGDILAYINCDEQYLPGALQKVADYFERHPEVDVLLGDCIVVNPKGEYLCERRSLIPQLFHTQVGTTLSFLTAALFLRRRVLEQHQLYFDTRWRDLGDADWALRAIRAGIRFGILGEFTSAFTDTGENMNLLPNARRESREMRQAAPAWVRATARLWVIHYRLRRFFAGHYSCKPHDYAIYTPESLDQRQSFHVANPTYRWVR
ncbi:MAG: glycosyltransferase family 2 protein [Verrucomicrobiota bacterium]